MEEFSFSWPFSACVDFVFRRRPWASATKAATLGGHTANSASYWKAALLPHIQKNHCHLKPACTERLPFHGGFTNTTVIVLAMDIFHFYRPKN